MAGNQQPIIRVRRPQAIQACEKAAEQHTGLKGSALHCVAVKMVDHFISDPGGLDTDGFAERFGRAISEVREENVSSTSGYQERRTDSRLAEIDERSEDVIAAFRVALGRFKDQVDDMKRGNWRINYSSAAAGRGR